MNESETNFDIVFAICVRYQNLNTQFTPWKYVV